MSRKKLRHFAEMKSFPNLFEEGFPSDPAQMKGCWSAYFKNNHPIGLELGCGSGTYTLALAERFPDRSRIGIDIKGARMWHGARAAVLRNMSNVAFVRARIENIETVFDPGEVAEIWVTFPDPHPSKGRARKRLTAPRFLEIYEHLFGRLGTVHLKTDHLGFFEYTLEVLQGRSGWTLETVVRDVHGTSDEPLLREVRTVYEERHLAEGRTIYYLRAGYKKGKG
jgi:tRNA (guanine-N7-)-methyltransferase